MKELYILRHCHAADIDGNQIRNDSDRPLTEKGFRVAEEIRNKLESLDLNIQTIMSSPVLRAKQTAEAIFPTQKIEFYNSVSTSGNLKDIISDLNQIESKSIVIVGHEPTLSSLISLLVFGDQSAWIHFRKGALCKLTLSKIAYQRCAELEWLIIPKLI